MKKKAFTIPEILIFMTIVGVICVMMITIIRPNDKYYKYGYYNAYYVLATAGYNILEDAMDKKNSGSVDTYPVEDIAFPKEAKDLCKKLALNPDTSLSGPDEDYGYINTTTYNCKTQFIAKKNPTDSDFAKGKESFKSTNSMRFFIGAKDNTGAPFNIEVPDAINGGSVNILFYLIWVDLNGDRGPNTAKIANNGRLPDIVPFAMTTTGKLMPLGYPTVDKTYMVSRIKYPTDAKTDYSTVDNYYVSQMKAYGNKEYPSIDVMSIRSSWNTFTTGTDLKVSSKYVPKETAQDTHCVPGSETDPSPCYVVIEEMKAF